MPRPKRVGDEDRRRVRKLHGQGLSRNEIARQTGRSGRTVSRLADELGLTFERGEQVRAATEARKVDAAAKRAQLANDLLDDAARLRQALWEACTVYNFGGKENTFEQALISEPSFADKRNILQAVATAVTKSLDIEKHDRDDSGGSAVDAWLDAMTGTP